MTEDLKTIVASRLKQCRADREWSLAYVTERLTEMAGTEISVSRYSNWENAHRLPKVAMIVKLGELYGVSASYLQGFSANDSETLNIADYVTANALTISTKNGVLPVLQASKDTAFHADYFKRRDLDRNRLLAIHQIDDSMDPLISKLDTVLVDTRHNRVQGRDLFALIVGDHLWIRWISKQLNDTYIISAENRQDHPDQVLDPAEFAKLEIVGRVCHIGHDR